MEFIRWIARRNIVIGTIGDISENGALGSA